MASKTQVRLPQVSGEAFAQKEFPFTNLVMEGGGAKGIAYVGAVKILEDAGIMKNIKRFAGTSAGAITAAMLAVGMTSEEIKKELSEVDMLRVVIDGGGPLPGVFKKVGLAFNVVCSAGANPGDRFLDWMGKILEKYLAKHKHKDLGKDVTFHQLYHAFGHELCIVAYNVQYAQETYFHVKTTPLGKVRDAVRMSMSIPVVFQPYELGEFKYMDGGLVSNFPVYCFDGWWLSLEKGDTFQEKMGAKSDAEVKRMLSPENKKERFGGPDHERRETLGMLLFSEELDREQYEYVFQERLSKLAGEDQTFAKRRPETEKAKAYKTAKNERDAFNRKAVAGFEESLKLLQKVNEVWDRSDQNSLKDNFMKAFEPDTFKAALGGFDNGQAFNLLFPTFGGQPRTNHMVESIMTNYNMRFCRRSSTRCSGSDTSRRPYRSTGRSSTSSGRTFPRARRM
ncbi:Hypp7914 [Branchiostoma lanceolatum]|uniref:Hypp7914 protein n=2 Tax=Branchiostoma lanceolatum TaxID=7740 RepID=A0A8K0EBZ0_BRALA|nr:Hypp7914 [Branchiostoma lanceolatum]